MITIEGEGYDCRKIFMLALKKKIYLIRTCVAENVLIINQPTRECVKRRNLIVQ